MKLAGQAWNSWMTSGVLVRSRSASKEQWTWNWACKEWFISAHEVLYEYIAILINPPPTKTISSRRMQTPSHWGIRRCYREELMLDSIRPNSSITIQLQHHCIGNVPASASFKFVWPDILWGPPSTTEGRLTLCFYPSEPLGFLAVEIPYRTN